MTKRPGLRAVLLSGHPAEAEGAFRAALDLDASMVEEILAGNIFHRGVVLGEPDPFRSGLDVDGLLTRILIDGEQRALTTDLQALTGDYMEVIETVAETLPTIRESLRKGDLIVTGSVVSPIPAEAGNEFVFARRTFRTDLNTDQQRMTDEGAVTRLGCEPS